VFLSALARRFTMPPANSTILASEFSAGQRVGGNVIFADGFD